MGKLRPCPFCGVDPRIVDGFGGRRIICDTCKVMMDGGTLAWNRRVALDRPGWIAVQEDARRWRERNTPEIEDFIEGTKREAVHQTERWGDAHDRDKSAENWYWLVGYLAGKALRSALTGDTEKAKHHTISTAAALLQWYKAISRDTTGCGIGSDTDLNPDPSNTELKR